MNDTVNLVWIRVPQIIKILCSAKNMLNCELTSFKCIVGERVAADQVFIIIFLACFALNKVDITAMQKFLQLMNLINGFQTPKRGLHGTNQCDDMVTITSYTCTNTANKYISIISTTYMCSPMQILVNV